MNLDPAGDGPKVDLSERALTRFESILDLPESTLGGCEPRNHLDCSALAPGSWPGLALSEIATIPAKSPDGTCALDRLGAGISGHQSPGAVTTRILDRCDCWLLHSHGSAHPGSRSMPIDARFSVAIAIMAAVAFGCRVVGLIGGTHLGESQKLKRFLDILPACAMGAVLGPTTIDRDPCFVFGLSRILTLSGRP
jgi:uncharacterized membrane protein